MVNTKQQNLTLNELYKLRDAYRHFNSMHDFVRAINELIKVRENEQNVIANALNEWVSVKDALPEPCFPVDFFVKSSVSNDIPEGVYSGYFGHGKCWHQDAMLTSLASYPTLKEGAEVTHWRKQAPFPCTK
ncbi:hypothetical protein [Enterobacter hormaechei]|uniref:hypothetical protein n=1 Tax=Enterobacter hormaechei TaxID=158836 RepID=UPI0032DA92FD